MVCLSIKWHTGGMRRLSASTKCYLPALLGPTRTGRTTTPLVSMQRPREEGPPSHLLPRGKGGRRPRHHHSCMSVSSTHSINQTIKQYQ